MRNFSFVEEKWFEHNPVEGKSKVAGETDCRILNRICEARRPEKARLNSATISLPERVGTLVWLIGGARITMDLRDRPQSKKRSTNDCSALLIHNIKYSRPTRGDTAVVLCHFSPRPYLKTLENFNSVRERLRVAKIPNFSAELAHYGREFVTKADFKFQCDSAMFHKENLWNLVAGRVPEEYKKLVFIDSDVLFSAPDWVDLCSCALDEFDLIQPMEMCIRDPFPSKNSIASGICSENKKQLNLINYHAGYALAARREWLSNVGGIYENALIGGGDGFFWRFVIRCFDSDCDVFPSSHKTENIKKHKRLEEYQSNLLNHKPKIGFLKGVSAVHMPHGNFKSRNYEKRLDQFSSEDFCSVKKNGQGIYEWTSPGAETKARAYFESREEDGPKDVSERIQSALASLDRKSVPIWCINLDRAKERRQYMELEWSGIRGVNLRFFEAFDKRDNLVFENGADGGVLPYSSSGAMGLIGRDLSQGERACRLSHFLCAEKMLREHPDAPFYVVCEDDAEPLFADEDDMFRRIVCGLKEHDGVDVLICHNIWFRATVDKRGLFSHLLRMNPIENGPYGTVCVVFSRGGIEQYMNSLEICRPADGWRGWDSEKYKIACLANNMVRHKAETTYIGNERGGKILTNKESAREEL